VKIYLLCPAYTATGGIELIHQLSYKLNLLGFDAYIFYVGVTDGVSPVLEVYEKYHVRMASDIEDAEENVVVLPEIYFPLTTSMKLKSHRVIWWMSVDNAKGTPEEFQSVWADDKIWHLSQSEYSTNFLRTNNVNEEKILWLSDYINSVYLHLDAVEDQDRDNIILFNPSKGFDMTSKIIGASTGAVKWIALADLKPNDMRRIMQHARVYIDFGNHPGRDRIPREATMCGCLIITNKKGAAKNDIDIMINERFKYDEDVEPGVIYNNLVAMVRNYSEYKNEFSEYVQRTKEEFKSFEVDALKCFSVILGKHIEEKSANDIKSDVIGALSEGNISSALQGIVLYRFKRYEEDSEFAIIEANVRLELGELFEAEYIIKKNLLEDINNYELHLLLAKTCFAIGGYNELVTCLNECQKAVEYSTGTSDEFVVFCEAKKYIELVKDNLNSLKVEK